MNEPKRGDFYRIRIYSDEVKQEIMKSESISSDELIIGKDYPAILEQHVQLKEGEPFFWDFCILGELGPIMQVRIMDKEIMAEKVWIKYVGSSQPEPVKLKVVPSTLEEVNKMIHDIQREHDDDYSPKYLNDLSVKQEELVSELLKPLVGRYFIARDRAFGKVQSVFRVIDVPQHRLTAMARLYNPRVIPVFKVANPEFGQNIGFERVAGFGELRSSAYQHGGIPFFLEEYKEITEEQFNEYVTDFFKGWTDNRIPEEFKTEGDDDK